MTSLLSLYDRLALSLDRASGAVLPTLARLVFAGVLFLYFWNSAQTKIGDGLFGIVQPSLGAYAQIFPRAMEAVSYDATQLGLFHWAVVVAGTVAEIVLPLLLLVGLFTRLAALGMIGFVIVQSLTDIYGHGAAADDIGRWFDGAASSLLSDQRSLWIFVLLVLVFRGAGPIALDRVLARGRPSQGATAR